jgi:hypothetical protein
LNLVHGAMHNERALREMTRPYRPCSLKRKTLFLLAIRSQNHGCGMTFPLQVKPDRTG